MAGILSDDDRRQLREAAVKADFRRWCEATLTARQMLTITVSQMVLAAYV